MAKYTKAQLSQIADEAFRLMKIEGKSLKATSKLIHSKPKTIRKAMKLLKTPLKKSRYTGKYYVRSKKIQLPIKPKAEALPRIMAPDERPSIPAQTKTSHGGVSYRVTGRAEKGREGYESAIAYIEDFFSGKDMSVNDVEAVIRHKFFGGIQEILQKHFIKY